MDLSDHLQTMSMDSNAPSGAASAAWQSAQELPQDPTDLDLRMSLDHTHYNIEQLRNQMLLMGNKQNLQATNRKSFLSLPRSSGLCIGS